MCTAITFKTKDFYFGRTLDYEFSFGEEVTITPRNYEIKFSNNTILKNHYSIIGMAHICNNYPLYYDAINEHGLAIAGLNFTRNAVYNDEVNEIYKTHGYGMFYQRKIKLNIFQKLKKTL